MASRAWASAEAVTVQVLMTMMSADAGVEAEVQPRSSNWRSRAAPSAWVARQPNCSMKKLGICTYHSDPKKHFTQSSRSTQRAQRREKLHSPFDCELSEACGLLRRTQSNHSGINGVRKDRYQGRIAFVSGNRLYSAEGATRQSFDIYGPSTVQRFRAARPKGFHCYSRLQREIHD